MMNLDEIKDEFSRYIFIISYFGIIVWNMKL